MKSMLEGKTWDVVVHQSFKKNNFFLLCVFLLLFFFNSPCHHSYSLFKNVINILLNIFARENNSHAGLTECSIPLIRIDVSLSTWTLGRGHVEINQ